MNLCPPPCPAIFNLLVLWAPPTVDLEGAEGKTYPPPSGSSYHPLSSLPPLKNPSTSSAVPRLRKRAGARCGSFPLPVPQRESQDCSHGMVTACCVWHLRSAWPTLWLSWTAMCPNATIPTKKCCRAKSICWFPNCEHNHVKLGLLSRLKLSNKWS